MMADEKNKAPSLYLLEPQHHFVTFACFGRHSLEFRGDVFSLVDLSPFMNSMNVQYPDRFEEPLSQLRLEGKMLHVKQHQLEITNVSKVAIDKMNDRTAFIDFPYNMYGKLKFSFPVEQLPAVKSFFRQHCHIFKSLAKVKSHKKQKPANKDGFGF